MTNLPERITADEAEAQRVDTYRRRPGHCPDCGEPWTDDLACPRCGLDVDALAAAAAHLEQLTQPHPMHRPEDFRRRSAEQVERHRAELLAVGDTLAELARRVLKFRMNRIEAPPSDFELAEASHRWAQLRRGKAPSAGGTDEAP